MEKPYSAMTKRLSLPREQAFLGLVVTIIAGCAGGPTLIPAGVAGFGTAQLSVMTFNVRYAHTQSPDLWPDRLPVITELIERRRPDVVVDVFIPARRMIESFALGLNRASWPVSFSMRPISSASRRSTGSTPGSTSTT